MRQDASTAGGELRSEPVPASTQEPAPPRQAVLHADNGVLPNVRSISGMALKICPNCGRVTNAGWFRCAKCMCWYD